MFKKILMINAFTSFLAISCASVVSCTNQLVQTTTQPKKFSHPNFTENLYFSNEIQKALADYKGENEPLLNHTHSVEIANLDDGFLFPVTDEMIFQKQLLQKEVIFENDSHFTQSREIPEQNLVNRNYQIVKKETSFQNSSLINFTINQENYQFKLDEKSEIQKVNQASAVLTKPVPLHTKSKTKYVLNQKVYYQKYNYLLPIENDKWCKKNTGISGKVYQISPQELFNEIKDNPELLEYYFGLNEFYQYQNFIGKNDSSYLVWVATRIISMRVEETWNELKD